MTKLNDMNYLTIVEDGESQYKTKLSLWRTVENKVWIEMGPEDNDPMVSQGMVLEAYDARTLLHELSEIVRGIEEDPIEETKALPLWAQKEKQVQKEIFANT